MALRVYQRLKQLEDTIDEDAGCIASDLNMALKAWLRFYKNELKKENLERVSGFREPTGSREA